MRIALYTLFSFSLGTFRMCGSDEPPEPSLGGKASGSVVAMAPSDSAPVALDAEPAHGGTIVRAGQHPIEVVPHESGEVYAYAPEGIDRPAKVEMTLAVPVDEGRSRPVQMRWNRRERRYEGRVRGVTIVPGPIVIDVVIGEEHVHGEVVVVVIAPAIHVDVHVHSHHGKHRKHRKHHKHRWH